VLVKKHINDGLHRSSVDNSTTIGKEDKKAGNAIAVASTVKNNLINKHINLKAVSETSLSASQSILVDNTPDIAYTRHIFCPPLDQLGNEHSQPDSTKENSNTEEIASTTSTDIVNGLTPNTLDRDRDLNSDNVLVKTTDDICVCPICDRDIAQLTLSERELHADQCAHMLLEQSASNINNTISKFINPARSTNHTVDYTKELASFSCCPVCRMAWSVSKYTPREQIRHLHACAQQCRMPLDKLLEKLVKSNKLKNNTTSSNANTTTHESITPPIVSSHLANRHQNYLNFVVKSDDDAFAPVLHTHRETTLQQSISSTSRITKQNLLYDTELQTALALSASMSTTNKVDRAKRQRSHTLKTLASDILCVNEALDLIRDRATYLLAEQLTFTHDITTTVLPVDKNDHDNDDLSTHSWIWCATQGEAPSHDPCYRTDILKNVQCQ
jgi:hypothetical protein